MKFPTVEFKNEQIDFLTNYCPKDDFFTSNNEIELICDNLEFLGKTIDEFRAIRNSVVKFYTELKDNELNIEKKRTDKYWKFHNAMMSVTAVIDNYMYNYNMTRNIFEI